MVEHLESTGVAVDHLDEGLRCYELHIGATHLAYNAWAGDDTELAATAERLRDVPSR